MRAINLSLLLAFIFISMGCTHQPTAVKENMAMEATRYSAVSSKSKDFVPKKGASFTWYEGGVIWAEAEQSPMLDQLAKFMLEDIKHELSQHGYVFTEASDKADYVIGAAVVRDNSESSEKVVNFFQIYPGIAESEDSKTATLIAAVVENDPWLLSAGNIALRQSLLWRSSIEAFVLDDVDMKTREERISEFVKVLMESFPKPQ